MVTETYLLTYLCDSNDSSDSSDSSDRNDSSDSSDSSNGSDKESFFCEKKLQLNEKFKL